MQQVQYADIGKLQKFPAFMNAPLLLRDDDCWAHAIQQDRACAYRAGIGTASISPVACLDPWKLPSADRL